MIPQGVTPDPRPGAEALAVLGSDPLRRTLRLWGLGLAVSIALGAIFAIQQLAAAQGTDASPTALYSLATQTLPWAIWAFLLPFIVEATARLRTVGARVRTVGYLGLAAGAVAVHIALLTGPTYLLGYFPELSLAGTWTFLVVRRAASEVIVVALIVAITHAALWAQRARMEELERSQLARDALQARLEALRTQLEPHFLLNTLHGISALAAAGEREATQQAIAETGDLLRIALRRPDLVPLRKEIDYLHLYMRVIHLARPRDATLRVDAAPGVGDCLVPSFILQPLVENALRHGAPASGREPAVEVRVERRGGDLLLRVRNRIAESHPPPGRWTEGIGFSNTRRRLETLYGDRANLDVAAKEGHVEIRVAMPIRRLPASGHVAGAP